MPSDSITCSMSQKCKHCKKCMVYLLTQLSTHLSCIAKAGQTATALPGCPALLSTKAILATWYHCISMQVTARRRGRMFLKDAIIATICTLSLLLLGKLACRTTWRPARTERGIGRKGQLTNVDKRKLQQNESEQIKKLQHHKGPVQRQDPVGLSPRHNNPCFKHAQTTDQPKLSKTDTERDKHYHTHKKRSKRLVYAAAGLDALTKPNGRQRSFQTAPAHSSYTDALHYIDDHLPECRRCSQLRPH